MALQAFMFNSDTVQINLTKWTFTELNNYKEYSKNKKLGFEIALKNDKTNKERRLYQLLK